MLGQRCRLIAIIGVAALAGGCTLAPAMRAPLPQQTGSVSAPADQPARSPSLCDHDPKVSDCHR